MSRIFVAQFIHRSTGALIEGHIRRTKLTDLTLQSRWKYSQTDEDAEWDWRAIFRECRIAPSRSHECYSVMIGSVLHGLEVLDLKAKHTHFGSAIGVEYLTTNPANRRDDDGLKHVGLSLLAIAIIRSLEVGAGGRLALEALADAIGFYEHLGFEKLPGFSPDGLARYALASANAKSLLDQIRAKGIVT